MKINCINKCALEEIKATNMLIINVKIFFKRRETYLNINYYCIIIITFQLLQVEELTNKKLSLIMTINICVITDFVSRNSTL